MGIREEIVKALEEIQPELHKAIERLVAIESVRGESLPEAPYGQGPKQALVEVLTLAEELGFETKNLDNKIGYAQYGESREDGAYYGIFGHVDVMPLGTGWESPALKATKRDGKLFGRGVLDNKGPILSNLFALYVLKEK